MRIIGGSHGGLRLNPPSILPVRPTTDMAKEALFNVLENRIDFDGIAALDLFSGTGNIAFELASRGAASVMAVDIHFKCVQYINTTAQKLNLTAIKALKADVLKFIPTCKDQFDLVFIDPPYELPQLPQLPSRIFAAGMLKPGGWLVLEHATARKIEAQVHLVETRKYGYSSFSFYQV
ncbi:RsmD family RNA methyltransferase [Parapedobacter koreensis]|uniref:16S rRNA (Guanine(966)-N(2))-methyltransferase RsmD n=1 Tax=Parapedobacter koreensis TaxID=332977 RepID=A0A1H7TQ12_9SPHI|nr:RsmD family RNA methyltransferase [Parapedobacter koreensis]SEL86768.1 16S rRNA (guanine(966)-N(2))-methyltransferase RsmD [Parapedobacter koreensis]